MTSANQGDRRTSPGPNWPGPAAFRVAATIVAVVVAWLAFTPATGADVGLPWDKANHGFAFLVLTVLTGCGWPGLSGWRLAAIMLAAGTGIELVQGLPAVGREADAMDVVADLFGFALGWLVLVAGRRWDWPGFRG